MTKNKVILDPHGRRMANFLAPEDLARLRDAAEVCWARDEPMPDDEIEKVREEVVAIITGR